MEGTVISPQSTASAVEKADQVSLGCHPKAILLILFKGQSNPPAWLKSQILLQKAFDTK